MRRARLPRSRLLPRRRDDARRRRSGACDRARRRRSARPDVRRGGGGGHAGRRPRTWSSSIEELSLNQGVDPRCRCADRRRRGGRPERGRDRAAPGQSKIVIPETGATLSAVGGLLSDLSAEFATTFVTSSTALRLRTPPAMCSPALVAQCEAFAARAGNGSGAMRASRATSRRDALSVRGLGARGAAAPGALRGRRPTSRSCARTCTRRATSVYGTHDPNAPAHIVAWRAHVSCSLRSGELGRPAVDTRRGRARSSARVLRRPRPDVTFRCATSSRCPAASRCRAR